MRIEAGVFRSRATDGTELLTDHRLSIEQADLLVRILERAGLTPDDAFAVEMSEGGMFVEHYDKPKVIDRVKGEIVRHRTRVA